jgi:hypothetical protein
MGEQIHEREVATVARAAAMSDAAPAVAAPYASGRLSVDRLLGLQRAAGNQAVVGALRSAIPSRAPRAAVLRYLEDIGPETFTDKNLVAVDESKIKKGQMSSAIPVTYRGTVHPGEGRDQIEPGVGSFEGRFKADVEKDPLGGRNRGVRYAGMPVDEPEYAKRNIATYELSKLLGEPIIPPTYAAKLGDKRGLVMKEAVGVPGNEAEAAEHRKDPLVRRALSNLAMLDVICGQVDRHPGNYIIELDGGKPVGVKGIDNDLSFGRKYEDIEFGAKYRRAAGQFRWIGGQHVQDLAEIDKTYAERIINLAAAPDAITKALTGLVAPEEIASTLKRLSSLANFLQPLMGKADGPVKTEWRN